MIISIEKFKRKTRLIAQVVYIKSGESPGTISTESRAVDFDLVFKNPVIFHGFELILQN